MKKIIPIIIALILCSVCFVTYKFYNALNVEETSTNKIKQNNNMLSMMIENNAGSGQYEMTTSSTWPTDGYVFNSELSKCENGGTLSWDDINKKVVFEGNNIDKCYVYFDVKTLTLAKYVIKQYTGTQGNNGLYFHDSNLTNGAGDNSYRYAGENPNNYVCLNSNASTCPEDNLYRIIGVFSENNHGVAEKQLVKVIKNTSYGQLAWDSSGASDWSTASLNETLNSTFITEKLSGVNDKIEKISWKTSGLSTSGTAKIFYDAEVTNSTKNYTAKIGLMYPSDYGFATTQDYWTTNLGSYSSAAYQKDWLYVPNQTEWTITPYPSVSGFVWLRSTSIGASSGKTSSTYYTRPTFFLTQSVQYISGSGQESDPIRIN